jgi:hypothetical protein
MQWSFFTEEKRKNQLAQTEFRFIKTTIIKRAAAITRCPPPPHQRYTAAKDGKFQGCHPKQSNAVEFVGLRKWKELTCANRVSLHKNNNDNKGGQLHVALRLYIRVAPQQKTANFKAAFLSRQMQWSPLAEQKEKNYHAA